MTGMINMIDISININHPNEPTHAEGCDVLFHPGLAWHVLRVVNDCRQR
jgi:hypothetical protein